MTVSGSLPPRDTAKRSTMERATTRAGAAVVKSPDVV
jgi:hypothetical protein